MTKCAACMCGVWGCSGNCEEATDGKARMDAPLVAGGQGRSDGDAMESAFTSTIWLARGLALGLGVVVGLIVAAQPLEALLVAMSTAMGIAMFMLGRNSKRC